MLPPLSLYIHTPWCVRKCPYCDFNSHKAAAGLPEQDYLAALKQDLARELAGVQGRKLRSVFFGGGTPSLMSAGFIGDILADAERQIGFAPGVEITLEANPGTAEQARFEGYRAAGVNRLSLGIQSLNPLHLKHLGRIHSAEEATSAVSMARRAGFDNINLDFMHGLPEQSPEDACNDLRQALALATEHLSWYQLTIEQNTEYYRHPPTLPEDDSLAEIQDRGSELLQAAGFRAYEVSAWSQPGKASVHNQNYWTFGDYIGIGAGAHGKISWPTDTGLSVSRHWKTRLPEHYLARLHQPTPQGFDAGRETVAADQLPLEFMMNALRLHAGVDETLYAERTGLSLAPWADTLSALRQQGLLQPDRLQTTELGGRFLNRLLSAFDQAPHNQ
ncbi:radical SAM family heme chaperone HemW [Simiduia agarivorans]|uniref:Heme chaperone HemW n=1 Tax=Simiduia agarivorans (strain DSM 21679 / JCM 13881 / BCRC 17597 / SA1) TaxID=1117647 RepID=K4KKA9_SIMAS|nr:radical SAM family heme chaperone HemW [Simiduia agarivorans]AFU99446.1 coproporphyrinogen III oxidase, anaerobic [Simiduia agarivorans SA1 = DSM 21679]